MRQSVVHNVGVNAPFELGLPYLDRALAERQLRPKRFERIATPSPIHATDKVVQTLALGIRDLEVEVVEDIALPVRRGGYQVVERQQHRLQYRLTLARVPSDRFFRVFGVIYLDERLIKAKYLVEHRVVVDPAVEK